MENAENAPSGIARRERQWAMIAHLAGLAGYWFPLGNLVGPLVVWQLKKEEFPFVDDQGREALNFQLSVIVYLVLSALLMLVAIGFVLAPAVYVAAIVLTVLGGVKANDGVRWRYPLTIRFLK